MPHYIYYGICGAIVILTIELLGQSIRKWIIKTHTSISFYAHFQHLIWGVILSTTSYAIILTKGQTILMTFLGLGIAYTLIKKKFLDKLPQSQILNQDYPKSIYTPSSLKFIIISSIGFLTLFSWEAYFFIKSSGFSYALPFHDTIFYGKISIHLSVTGHENLYCYEDFIAGNKASGISLYHFFELWFNNLLANTFHLLNVPCLVLLTQVLFTYICFIGWCALLEFYQKVTYKYLLLLLALLVIESVFFEFYNSIDKLQYLQYIRFSLLGHISKKTAIYFICFIGFILYCQRQDYLKGVVLLLCLPVMTITAFPSIIGGLIIWSAYLWFFQHHRIAIPILGLVIFEAIFLLGFYAIFGQTSSALHPVDIFTQFSKPAELLSKINLFIGIWIQIGILYAPYLVILLVLGGTYDKRQVIILGTLFLGIAVSGLLIWIILFKVENTYQLFYNTTLSFLNVLIGCSIITHLVSSAQKRQIRIIVASGLWIIVTIYNFYFLAHKQEWQYNSGTWDAHNKGYLYDDTYLTKISQVIQKYNLQRGASYIDSTTYKQTFLQVMPHMMRLGDYLPLMANIYTVSINDASLPLIPNIRQNHLQQLPFYQFHQAHPHQSIKQTMLEFMREHQIDFLVLSRDAPLNSLILPYVTEQIQDSTSGERFIILNTKKFHNHKSD